MAFFDVRVFNSNISKTYKLNEKEKKRLYSERITEIKHGSFTPLVMSATGGMPPSMKLHQEVSPKCVNEEAQLSVAATTVRSTDLLNVISRPESILTRQGRKAFSS